MGVWVSLRACPSLPNPRETRLQQMDAQSRNSLVAHLLSVSLILNLASGCPALGPAEIHEQPTSQDPASFFRCGR